MKLSDRNMNSSGIFIFLSTSALFMFGIFNGNCMSTIKREGTFRIYGKAKRSWTLIPHCDVFMLAPPMQNVRIVFRTVNVDCDTSGVMIQDGWTMLANNWGEQNVIPYESATNPDNRRLYVCSKNFQVFNRLTMSQNYGQITYKIQTNEDVIFDVSFVPTDDVCNSLITAEPTSRTYVARIGQSAHQTCRIYISGGARLKLLELTTDGVAGDSTCDKNDSVQMSLQMSGTSWKQQSTSRKRQMKCKTDSKDITIPCQFSVLEMHGGQNEKTQYVKFTVTELSDVMKEPWSALCYH